MHIHAIVCVRWSGNHLWQSVLPFHICWQVHGPLSHLTGPPSVSTGGSGRARGITTALFKSLAETRALVKSHCQPSTRAQSSATVSLLQVHCVNAPSEARFLSLETIWQNTAPIFCNKEASIIVKGQEHGKLHTSLNINFPICKKRTTSVTS